MKKVTMTAQNLLNIIGHNDDSVDLYVSGVWKEITHIANHQIVNGSWVSDGNTIFIETGDLVHQYQLMDVVTVRYPDNPTETATLEGDDEDTQPIVIDMTEAEFNLLGGYAGHPDDEDFDDDFNYPDDDEEDDGEMIFDDK